MNEISLTIGALGAACGLFMVGTIFIIGNSAYKRMRLVDANDIDIEFNNGTNDIRRIINADKNG